jgi:hypothetical protein
MKTYPFLALALILAFGLLDYFLLVRRRKKVTIRDAFFVVGGWLFVSVLIVVVVNVRQSRALAPFQPYLDEYIYLPGEKAGNTVLQMTFTHPAGSPYIRGKIIPVNVLNNTLDVFYFDLPEELRAENPDEVGSILWLYCVYNTEKVTFAAGSRKETNNYTCDVAVIDRSEQAIVAQRSFQKTAGEQGVREILYPDIIQYLTGLPRK